MSYPHQPACLSVCHARPAIFSYLVRATCGCVKLRFSCFAECESLIRSLLSLRPADRPTLEEIMVHPWILKGDFISR